MSGSLYEHALALHRRFPDGPLPGDAPCPDESLPRSPLPGRRKIGADVARVLDRYFAAKKPSPERLAEELSHLAAPIHPNDHITAAALRARRSQVRRTGRWLVRHGRTRQAAVVGLALLGTGHDERDIPLIKTIGMLSNHFGALADDAMSRRPGGWEALLWLGARTTGWGRVHVVEALCRLQIPDVREWLLRHACDGGFFDGYHAGRVATAAHLHLAITAEDADEALVDHTGRLLYAETDCSGMGMTLRTYPPAAVVEAYTAHAARLPRTRARTALPGQLAAALLG